MARTDLQMDWLRAFVAVVDNGSLSAAAPQVHRSQSAVSMQLLKLEEAVGGAVLRRGPRHLSLTPLGTELLGYARRILALHGEALTALTGALAFHMDGVFIGATWSSEMRNMMILALLGYLASVAALVPLFGNHGLWISFLLFMVLRGLTLGAQAWWLKRNNGWFTGGVH